MTTQSLLSHRLWTGLYMAALFVLVAVLPGSLGFAQEGRGELSENELLDQQGNLEAQMQATQEELAQVKKEKKTVLGDLNVIDRDLLSTRTHLDQLKTSLQNREDELSRTEAEFDRAQYEYDVAQAQLSARLRSWYKSQRSPFLQIFTTSTSLTDLVYRLRYAKAALDTDRATIAFIHDQRAALEQSQDTVEAEMKQIRAIEEEVREAENNYQTLRSSKNVILNSIIADQRQLEKAYSQLEQAGAEIEWQLAKARGEITGDFNKTFIHPLPGYAVTSGYGYRNHPILKKRKLHTGLDIGAPGGTPIRCAAPGVVFFAGWKNGYGNTVIVNHGLGYATLYAHQSKILVSVGDEVLPGAILGKVGTTGLSTGNHLHFEIRIDGKTVDPAPFVL